MQTRRSRDPGHSVPMPSAVNRRHSRAVVLAGGDGTRLQGLTQLICGDQRPKHSAPFLAGRVSWPTRRSAWVRCFHKIIPGAFWHATTSSSMGSNSATRTTVRSIVQPMNRGTGVAIAVALLRIVRFDPDAIVASFPLGSLLCSALHIATGYPHSLILIGAEADSREIEYGWIEPGRVIADSHTVRLQRSGVSGVICS
jgi:mannose-1-phosphate guanylyltransferase